LLVSAVVLACGLWAPAGADESNCPLHYRAKAAKDLGDGLAPLAIGDSVMVYGVTWLSGLGFRVDARMCREWPEGRELIERLRRQGRLPRRVVIALGSTGEVTIEEIERTLPLLRGPHTLALVTPRDPGKFGGGTDAENVRRVVSEHPRKLRLLDWVRYSRGKDRWFFDDGVHVKKKHIGRYVGCIKQALPRYRSAEHLCSPAG
jgi:hypothetical protein